MGVWQGTLSVSRSVDAVAFAASLCCIQPWLGAHGKQLPLLTVCELRIAASDGGVVSMSITAGPEDGSQLMSSQAWDAMVDTVGGFLREGAREVARKGRGG